jgi:hypothetical protein
LLLLDLVDLINGPSLADMLPERVEHLVKECAMAQLDQLGGHHCQRIFFRNTVGTVPLSLNGL